jgi:hypothetical protein
MFLYLFMAFAGGVSQKESFGAGWDNGFNGRA